PRPGHARGDHGPAGHLQDARPRAHAPAGPTGPPPRTRPAVSAQGERRERRGRETKGRTVSVDLLLSAGRGPQECAWALARLLRRLEADATRQKLETRRVQTVPGDRPDTYRSVVVHLVGAGAEAFAASWTGTL